MIGVIFYKKTIVLFRETGRNSEIAEWSQVRNKGPLNQTEKNILFRKQVVIIEGWSLLRSSR